jgi:heat-inducible transcriptional repressor
MDSRKARILSLVVERYIDGIAPVPSQRLASELGVSSATVRNELAALEAMGFLTRPHHSAGRLPTAGAFAFYARRFLPPEPLDEARRERVERVLGEFRGDDQLRAASRLLSWLTGYVAITVVPRLGDLKVAGVHLTALGPDRILAVVVLEGGVVAERHLVVEGGADAGTADRGEEWLRVLIGTPLAGLSERLIAMIRSAEAGASPDLLVLGRTLLKELGDVETFTWFHEGTARVLLEPEFQDAPLVWRLLSTLEDPVAAIGAAPQPGEIALDVDRPDGLSIVRSGFAFGAGAGQLVVLGPLRMRYGPAIQAAKDVGDRLSEVSA